MGASWDFGDSTSGTGSPSGGPAPGSSWGTPTGPVPPRVDPAWSGAGGGGGSGGGAASTGTASPPLLWLGLAVLLALVGLVVGLVTDSGPVATLAWLVGGPLAIGMFAVFVHRDTLSRAHPWYAASAAADWGRRAAVVLSLAAVAVNAWTIADSVARGSY